jgi:hypothetical protein
MGVDAVEVAPAIAYRSGYQPAVLLRFGERLLDTLDDRYPDVSGRDHVVVTSSLVAEVFQHQSVQDEIRTVVRNNFQGNDAGQAVFSATLLAFAGLAPGEALPNAPKVIWRRLRDLIQKGDPNVQEAAGRIGWLSPRAPERLEPGPETIERTSEMLEPTEVGLSTVNRHLGDFVERKLLVLVNRDDAVFRLRFSYHLPILLEGAQDEAWTALIRLGRKGDDPTDDGFGDPVSSAALRDLETVLRKYQDLGLDAYRAAVLGSLWPDSVANPDWLADRLGYDPSRMSRRGAARPANAAAYLEVAPAEADQVLADRPPNSSPALLVGGADLLRWGLTRIRAGEEIEVQGQSRLTRAAVAQWFVRVRAFDFDRDKLDRAIQITGCIPYLIQLLDLRMRSEVGADGGVSVGSDEFIRAVDKYEKKLPEHLRQLVSGPEATRLSPRERELLLMVTLVAGAFDFKSAGYSEDLRDELWDEGMYRDLWLDAYPDLPYPARWGNSPEDRLASRVVWDLGLLPYPLDQRAPQGPYLSADDPLVRDIVPALARPGVHH